MMRNPFRSILFTEPFLDGEDPQAAPSQYCRPDQAPRRTVLRWVQNQGWLYLFGLLFMFFAVGEIGAGDPGRWQLALRIAVVVAIGLCYIAAPWIADLSLSFRWLWIALFTGLTLLTIPYQELAFSSYGVYISLLIATLIPWRSSRWVILGWNLVVGITALMSWSFGLAIVAGMGLVVGWSAGGGFEAGRLRRHLYRAEQRVATLSVQAERERIARDLHDILGHSLTAISIKSGLAARLAEQDPAAAKAQMTEVEQIARDVLTDVRATTTGMRQVRLATEIASARSVLMAAGVEAAAPSALPILSEGASELTGYLVREAVTNVVRHAEATRCMITIDDHAVAVVDDGIGLTAGDGSGGSGLTGLRHRISDAGGTLTLGTPPEGGTEVRAEWPIPLSKINNNAGESETEPVQIEAGHPG